MYINHGSIHHTGRLHTLVPMFSDTQFTDFGLVPSTITRVGTPFGAGERGTCFKGDGSTNRVELTGQSPYWPINTVDASPKRTIISFWFRINPAISGNHPILSIGNTSTDGSPQLLVRRLSGNIQVFTASGGNANTGVAADSEWHLFADDYSRDDQVFGSSAHRIYLDGVNRFDGTDTPSVADSTLFIGAGFGSATANVQIRDLRILHDPFSEDTGSAAVATAAHHGWHASLFEPLLRNDLYRVPQEMIFDVPAVAATRRTNLALLGAGS